MAKNPMRIKNPAKKAKALNFPSYKSFQALNRLARKLIKMIPRPLSEEEKIKLFTGAGLSSENGIMDAHLFSASCYLNCLLLACKELYRKNNILFYEDKIISDEKLCLNMLNLKDKLSGALCLPNMEMHPVESAKKMIQSIENEFYLLKDINLADVKTRTAYCAKITKRIKETAMLLKEVAEVMHGFFCPLKANKASMLADKLKDIDKNLDVPVIFEYFDLVVNTHAFLNDQHIAREASQFLGLYGENIELIMQISKVVSTSVNIYLNKRFKEDNLKYQLSNLPSDIAIVIINNDILLSSLEASSIDLAELENYLFTMGIPFGLAKNFSFQLADRLCEQDSSGLNDNAFQSGDKYANLYYSGAEQGKALRMHASELLDIDCKQLILVTHKNDKSKRYFPQKLYSIWDAKKNTRVEEGFYESGKKSQAKLLNDMCSGRDYDICLGYYSGCCTTLNIDENSTSNPKICRIEAYCNTSQKRFLGKISLLSILFHEAVHLGQIGSSLIWRYNALHYSLMLLEHFENELLLAGYGAKSFGFNVGDVLRNENDVHKNVSEAFVLLLAQALGKGKTAKNSRNTGILKISGSDEKEILEKLNKISIEDSQTSRLLGEIQREMLSEKISSNKLNFLKKKLKAFMEEIREISECQAEAFCYVLLKDFLENLPDRRITNYSPKKICELLISSRIRRGKQSQAYYTAKRRSKTKSEFTAMLRKEGLRYQRCICVKNDIEPIFSLLVSLGYNPLDPMSAYLDMEELKARAKKAGVRFANCLKPINSAEASSAKTYSANIELILKTIEKFGVKKSFKMILDAESAKEIRSWLK